MPDVKARRRSERGYLRKQKKQGFTLLEVLVASAIMTISVVGSLSALGSTARVESREEQSEFLLRLAHEEYSEVVATQDLTQGSLNGDFQDRNLPDYTWTADLEPTPTTNMDALTVTVQNSQDSTQQAEVEGLVYVPAATSTTSSGGTTPGGGAGGGGAGGGGG